MLAGAVASTFLLQGCTSIVKNSLAGFYQSDDGKFVSMYGARYAKTFDEGYYVNTRDFFNRDDAYSLEPVCVFFPGWGCDADQAWASDGKDDQLLGMLNTYYQGRVWVINSPTNTSAQNICSNVEHVLNETLDRIREHRPDTKIPEIDAISHSYGSVPLRYYLQEHPEDITCASFIAAPFDGISFELEGIIKFLYPYIMTDLLQNNGKQVNNDNLQSGYDIEHGSNFLTVFNRTKPYKKVPYIVNIYGIETEHDRWIIPGKDDRLVPLSSAIPIDLLQKGAMGYPFYGDCEVFITKEDHYSCLKNKEIVEDIATTLRYGPKHVSIYPPTWNTVVYTKIQGTPSVGNGL